MRKFALAIAVILLVPVAAQAATTPVDLRDFFADPTVTVAGDGSSALIEEDALLSPVLLSNDPGLGDPVALYAVIGGMPQTLMFDYTFILGAGADPEDDEFGAFVLDSGGGSPGAAYEFFTATPGGGTVSIDLGGLAAEPFIGLQFELNALFGDVGLLSAVEIRDVRTVNTPTTPTVPLPPALWLGLGLLATCAAARRIRRRSAR